MSEESVRFRNRAQLCRELAEVARDDYSRQALARMAVDLDAESDSIEAQEGTIPIPDRSVIE